ncbi:MAG: sugar ABC transporter permease [Candidatus Saccharibacteria bacterium]|nr:sugar ABC transporter permease [Rhodoferax sp.]
MTPSVTVTPPRAPVGGGNRPAPSPGMLARIPRNWWPYLLVLPAVLVLAVTVLYPIGFNLFASLHQWNMIESDTPQAFVGTGTLAKIIASPHFWNALRVTLAFTVCAVALEFFVGLALALMVNEDIYGGRLLRTLLVAPIMATPLVVALVFKLLWHSEFGIINYMVSWIGLGPYPWLAEAGTAFFAVLVTEVWHNTSFVFLVLLGALQMLPRSPFEAAMVEGASWWQRVRYVALPMLKPAILVALLFRVVFAIRLFDEVWVLTRGGPNGATETISMLLYRSAFENFDASEAAGLSVLLLILTSALAWALIRTLYGKKP